MTDDETARLIEGLVSRIGQPRTCACPSRDPFDCIRIRHHRWGDDFGHDGDYVDEPCECSCHDELDEDDEW